MIARAVRLAGAALACALAFGACSSDDNTAAAKPTPEQARDDARKIVDDLTHAIAPNASPRALHADESVPCREGHSFQLAYQVDANPSEANIRALAKVLTDRFFDVDVALDDRLGPGLDAEQAGSDTTVHITGNRDTNTIDIAATTRCG